MVEVFSLLLPPPTTTENVLNRSNLRGKANDKLKLSANVPIWSRCERLQVDRDYGHSISQVLTISGIVSFLWKSSLILHSSTYLLPTLFIFLASSLSSSKM